MKQKPSPLQGRGLGEGTVALRDPRLIEFAKQMRREPTKPELKMWFELRAKRFCGIKFRKQNVIGPYIADFCSRTPMLVIEIDGDTHSERHSYDATRTRYLEDKGYQVVRFTNQDVMQNLEGVLAAIQRLVQQSPLPTHSPKEERAL